MPPTSSTSASVPNRPSTLTFMLPRKVIFKFISALQLWLIYKNLFSITLLHVLFPCLKNCSPISLQDFLHTSSVKSFMKTLITNQFTPLTHQFLHFILTIQPISLKYFSMFPTFLLCNSKFLPQRRAHDSKKAAEG